MDKPDIGEQAVSKAAEIGIESQLDQVEAINVDIRTNPLDLAQGKLESVTVDGQGMVMKQDLRAERLILQTDSVSIDSLKIALGNIELEQSTNAKAKVVLLEEDIQRAFNSEYIKNKLKNKQVNINGEQITVNAHNVHFALPDNQKISLTADIELAESGETKNIALSANPVVDVEKNKIVLQDVQYHDEKNAAFTQALLNSTQEILDLRNFELKGISLQIERLDISSGKMTIAAKALVKEFPDS